MNCTSRFVAGGLFCVLAVGAQAATKTWVGPAIGDWSTGTNWSPVGAPASGGTVVFTNEVSVNVAADVSATVSIPNGGKLTKTGAGVLTLQANPGINPGQLIVASGSVVLSGPDVAFGQALGAFGTVTVKSGASVSVAKSSAATRHGGVYQMGKPKDTSYSDGKKDTYGYLQYNLTIGSSI